MTNVGCFALENDYIDTNSVKLRTVGDISNKTTGLRPNQYPNTEMSPNQ